MAKVAFCGLGLMGRPMAARLLEAGHDLSVWNRTARKARPLGEAGARVADTAREAAQGAEVVITMVADEHALEEVVWSDDGVAAGTSFGSTLVEMSTVGPDAVRRLRDRLPEDVELIDAPVLGSVPAAESGTLTILVGGNDGAFEHHRDLLSAIGRPRHVGPLGAGAALKLVFNSTLGAAMAALGEALALAEALGADRATALDVLEGSHLATLARGKRDKVESGSYDPNFALGMAAKDMRLVTEAAERAGISLEVAAVARRLLEEAVAAGRSAEDYSALIAHIAERARRAPG
ncbi:MAG: NAD(P)-dependent oxidoreductase [Actinobacteria bacterium]|nr:NAD(P)-dependent oxidoreductase [Actinomycetota bacterium]